MIMEEYILTVNFPLGGRTETIYPAVLKDKEELILVDAGYPGQLGLFRRAAELKGLDLDLLTKIIITHHDFDHVGSLAEMKRAFPKAKIVSSEIEAAFISGKKKSQRLEQAEHIFKTLPREKRRGALAFQNMLAQIEKVDVDITVHGGALLPQSGGIRVIATPGHMEGHISLYIEETKTLVSGDAVVIEDGKLSIANPQFTLNIEQVLASLRELLAYDIQRIICYHGGLFSGDCRIALEDILSSYTSPKN
jgi:glyoxylase-like metal-dependent hydrolase (beta-lactamase superfamily II)